MENGESIPLPSILNHQFSIFLSFIRLIMDQNKVIKALTLVAKIFFI